jgi:hypothetical protein
MSIVQVPLFLPPEVPLHGLAPEFVDWLTHQLQPIGPAAQATIDAYVWRSPHSRVEVDSGISVALLPGGRRAHMLTAGAAWTLTLEELEHARRTDAELPIDLSRMQSAVLSVMRLVDDVLCDQPGPYVAVTSTMFAPPQWVTESEDSAGNVVSVAPHIYFGVRARVGDVMVGLR